MNMNMRDTDQIRQLCDVISQHPDASNDLLASCKSLSEDIGNTDRFTDLAIALYRSFAFTGCIQFSARDPETKILCGRVWESMMAGCALVEEENIETKELLVPYFHYVPFNSIRELAVALACLKKYPELREDIARRGYEWVHRLLNAEKLWAHILCR